MHFYLSLGDKGLQQPPAHPAQWGGWSYFIYTFLPQHNQFTSDELLYNFASVFEENTQVIAGRIRYVLGTYTNSSALASCKFMTLEGDRYFAGNATLRNSYMIGYFLAKLWQRDFCDTTSIVTNDMIGQKMGLAPILGIEKETLQDCLNQLETLALLEQRRTVSPAQIVRRWDDPLTLLEKAYAY